MNFDKIPGGGRSNKPFDFDADANHDLNPGIFKQNFTTAGWSSCKHFTGPVAALAEVCRLRMLLVSLSIH